MKERLERGEKAEIVAAGEIQIARLLEGDADLLFHLNRVFRKRGLRLELCRDMGGKVTGIGRLVRARRGEPCSP